MKDYKNGTYQGQVSNDTAMGKGTFFWNQGDFYFGMKNMRSCLNALGDWIWNQMTGNGEYFFHNGGSLKGSMKAGLPQGLAKLELPNGNLYYGFFLNGAMHGKGLLYIQTHNSWRYSEFINGAESRVLSSGQGKPTNFRILLFP